MVPVSLQSTAPVGMKAPVSLCYCALAGYMALVSLLCKALACLVALVSLIPNISNPDLRLGECPKTSSVPVQVLGGWENQQLHFLLYAGTENCTGDGRCCGTCCS